MGGTASTFAKGFGGSLGEGGSRPWRLANFQALFGHLTGEVARPTLWRGRPRPRSRRFSAGLTIPDRPRPGGPG